MEQTLILIGCIIVAFVVGLFSSKASQQEDAKILDLTAKINSNKDAAAKAQVDADKKAKEYQDALKKYDPNFYGPDDDGKPSA